MAITPPPKKTGISENKSEKANEKKIQEVINKGGSTTRSDSPESNNELRSISIKLYDNELQTIQKLREQRPRQRGQKRLGISLHDWVVEAVQEKILRETKKQT